MSRKKNSQSREIRRTKRPSDFSHPSTCKIQDQTITDNVTKMNKCTVQFKINITVVAEPPKKSTSKFLVTTFSSNKNGPMTLSCISMNYWFTF
jgi:hypothetical protein